MILPVEDELDSMAEEYKRDSASRISKINTIREQSRNEFALDN